MASEEQAASSDDVKGLVEQLSGATEEALGELAQTLLENDVFNQALAAALGAGERAIAAQRSAMSALNIPSGSDLERLERRLRSLSDRLEAVEDRLDDLAAEAARPRPGATGGGSGGVASDQGRLTVSDSD
jgi:hypothetical protein